MVSEQLQSMGISRLDRIMEEINRKHELVISITAKIIEAKLAFRDKSNNYSFYAKMFKASDVQMGDSGSESEEDLIKQVSPFGLSIDDDSVAVIANYVVNGNSEIMVVPNEKVENEINLVGQKNGYHVGDLVWGKIRNQLLWSGHSHNPLDAFAEGENVGVEHGESGICMQGTNSNQNSVNITIGLKGNNRLPKMDFPLFGRKGPREWLRKAMKYFQIHETLDELRLGIAEMHLEVKAYV